MLRTDVFNGRTLRVGGAMAMAFSGVLGLLIVFVLPASHYTSGFLLLIFGFIFLAGGVVFLYGMWSIWKPMLQAGLAVMASVLSKLF